MLILYDLLSFLPNDFVPRFSPRINQLCMFLLERDVMERKEAAKEFLGSYGQLDYFNKLLHELKKYLTRYLLADPLQTSETYLTNFEPCYRNYNLYKMLLANGKRKAAMEIATYLLPKLKKAELYTLAHSVATDLTYHYSHSGKKDKGRLVNKYRKETKILFDLIKIESVVKDYHSHITFICNSRESFGPADLEEFKEAIRHTRPYLQLGHHSINKLIYSIIIFRYAAVADHENALKYCDEALNNIPKNYAKQASMQFSFLHKKIPPLIALERLDEAKNIAKDACQMMPIGGSNWHLALIKRVEVCFYTGDYQEAYELFKAYEQQRCDDKEFEELWNILKGYLYFLIERKKIVPYAQEKFNLGKFLNEVPIFSKDKAGHNINILIIQILIRMQRGQFGFIIDQIESLQQYVRTYTRNPETKRANLFIRMIIKMEAAHFHRSGTEYRTQNFLNQLNAIPLRLGQNVAIEIIPFPVLWEEILAMLKDGFSPSRKRKKTNV